MADTENEVIRELTTSAQRPQQLEPGHHYAWFDVESGEIAERDLTDALPAFKEGVTIVRDVASFAAYFGKHADDDTEVYADIEGGTITAVLDAHHSVEYAAGEISGARWQQHRLVLKLTPTLPWVTWMTLNRQPQGQQQFSEFLEDNLRDLDANGEYAVDGATFLEMAQSFQATLTAEVEEAHRLDNGQTELVYKETVGARAGKTNRIEIPTMFSLAIKPYEDCATAQINARFRYRIGTDKRVSFIYVLDNPERRRQDAVNEIVDKLAREIGNQIEAEPGEDSFAVEGLVTPRTIMLGFPSS